MTRPIPTIIGAIVTAQASAQVPSNITEAIAMFGGGARGKSAIAVELSGSSDKKSKTYKAALRNVQRYEKQEKGEGGQTRRPRAGMREKLQKIGEAQAKAGVEKQMRAQGASVIAAGTVKVSDEEREREYIPELYLFPTDMDKILDAYNAGDYLRMEDAFNKAFFDAYDIARASFTDFTTLDITAGATASAVRYDIASYAAGR